MTISEKLIYKIPEMGQCRPRKSKTILLLTTLLSFSVLSANGQQGTNFQKPNLSINLPNNSGQSSYHPPIKHQSKKCRVKPYAAPSLLVPNLEGPTPNNCKLNSQAELSTSRGHMGSIKRFGLPEISRELRPEFPVSASDLKYLPYGEHMAVYNMKTHTGFLTIQRPKSPYDEDSPPKEYWNHRPNFTFDKNFSQSVQASTKDYKDKVYSRGHLAPFGDTFSKKGGSNTFKTTSIAPQVQISFNDGVWNDLEECVRIWRDSGRDLTVYTGVIFAKPDEVSKLNGKISIPHQFYKIMVDGSQNPPLAVSVIMENRKYGQDEKDLSKYITSIGEIERKTGLTFLNKLPPETRTSLVSSTFPLWSGCEKKLK